MGRGRQRSKLSCLLDSLVVSSDRPQLYDCPSLGARDRDCYRSQEVIKGAVAGFTQGDGDSKR